MVDVGLFLFGTVCLLSSGFMFGRWVERRLVRQNLLQAHRIHAPVLIERGAYYLVEAGDE